MSEPTPKLNELVKLREKVEQLNSFVRQLSHDPRINIQFFDVNDTVDESEFGAKYVSSDLFTRLLQDYLFEHFKLNRDAVITNIRQRADRELSAAQTAAKHEYKQLIGDLFDEPQRVGKRQKT
jgi:hypothetical protein